MQNLRTHIGGDVTLADLAGHRATLLQGPRFVGTGHRRRRPDAGVVRGRRLRRLRHRRHPLPRRLRGRRAPRRARAAAPRRVPRPLHGRDPARAPRAARPARDARARVARSSSGRPATSARSRCAASSSTRRSSSWASTSTATDKVGVDAGELCGLDPVGVAATDDVDAIVALGADCVLYMGRFCDLDAICRAARVGRQRRHDPRRVPPPAEHGSRRPGAGRGRLPRRGHVDPQHRQQPRLHHRGRAARAHLDPAPPRRPHHRGVRRHVAAQLARADLPDHGLRPAARGHRRAPAEPRPAQLRPVAAPDRRDARDPARLGGGERRGGRRPLRRRDRRRARSTPARSPPSGRSSTASATGGRCCGSSPPGTAPPTSTRRGTCAGPAGGSRSRATPRSTSSCCSRSRSSRWPSTRPATPPTAPSTPCRSCARPPPGIRTTADLPQIVADLS